MPRSRSLASSPEIKKTAMAVRFVGPAGALLDRALSDADVDRTRAYVTNAVKHFKFESRGKRRLHKRPSANELRLFDEIEVLRPQLIVALGATAAHGLTGRSPFRETAARSWMYQTDIRSSSPSVRAVEVAGGEEKRSAYAGFVYELRSVGQLVGLPGAKQSQAPAVRDSPSP
jgi:uracil-DNA glycosylase family 4